MHQFSIITPTFNRAKYLTRIYDCLCRQDDIDLEWIIIDDGSTDNTREIVLGFEKTFEIKYMYQENAGKPSAMNAGMQIANSYIMMSLDSEDIIYPNVLKTVWNYFDAKTGKFENDCACLSGLCQYENGVILGKKFPNDYFVSDYIRYVKNKKISGDKSEFYVTEIFRMFPFPIFENEKNIRPSVVITRIALTHKTLYVNIVFQEKQFLQGGLSSQNYLLMYPLGAELFYNERSIPPHSFKLQVIHSGKYILFAKINRKKNIYGDAKNKLIFPLGKIYYFILCIKTSLKKIKIIQNANNKLKEAMNKNKRNQKIIKSG